MKKEIENSFNRKDSIKIMSNPNGASEEVVYFVDIATSDYSQSSVHDIDDVECYFCCRIVGSTPCTCSQEEDSDMEISSEMEITDEEEEEEKRQKTKPIVINHFPTADLQVTKMDYSTAPRLPPAAALTRSTTSF